MNQEVADPYKTPMAELTTGSVVNDILKFKRFSAWGVLGLSVITLGIYPIYWLCTRATVVNLIHNEKISSGLILAMILVTIMSFGSGFLGDSVEAMIAGSVISLIYMVVYVILLFKVRNRLQDIMNQAGGSFYKLNPVLTFLFFSIYLQFKINQCFDECTQIS